MGGYNYESFGQCEVSAPDFWSVAKVGEGAPDFTLTDLDGHAVSLLARAAASHVLLEFGSIT